MSFSNLFVRPFRESPAGWCLLDLDTFTKGQSIIIFALTNKRENPLVNCDCDFPLFLQRILFQCKCSAWFMFWNVEKNIISWITTCTKVYFLKVQLSSVVLVKKTWSRCLSNWDKIVSKDLYYFSWIYEKFISNFVQLLIFPLHQLKPNSKTQ